MENIRIDFILKMVVSCFSFSFQKVRFDENLLKPYLLIYMKRQVG